MWRNSKLKLGIMSFQLLPQESPDLEEPMENSACEDLVDESPSDPHIMDTTEKDFNGLTDIYWVC